MISGRSIEDRLREQYFDLLPDVRRIAEQLETEARYFVLAASLELNKYEELIVKSRVKECESAIQALRRRQEGGIFDTDRPEIYSLTNLKDLAGARVLAFPRSLLERADRILRAREPFLSWEADHILDPQTGGPLALKYHGYCGASDKVKGELQLVPMLIGLFWEVEHAAIYKPTPSLKGMAGSLEMEERILEIHRALMSFEDEFEGQVRKRDQS